MEEEAAVALTIPALVAERIATHADDIVLRKKDHGIWKATTWAQLGARVREVGTGLKAIGFRPGDVACVLAETRPEWVHIDLGILGAGGVSGGIHPEQEAEPLGQALRDAACRVLFVENEEQLDKALLVRDRCPDLRRIVVIDMKGLRDFADPMCESLEVFRGTHGQRWRLGRGNRGNRRRPTGGSTSAAHRRESNTDPWRRAAPDRQRALVAAAACRR